MNDLEIALRENVDGEIHFDTMHRHVYSVDASIYEVLPIGIVIPRNKTALINAVRFAHEHGIPVIARGAATGITGGCIGQALIIDTSKYLNNILKVDYDQEYVICEPGVVQDRLNEELASRGYRLGPDTSTGNRATIGGMLANNAAGARSLLYGTMADHVLEVELVLANSEVLNFASIDEDSWKKKSNQQNTEGRIYKEIDFLKKEYQKDIAAHFPKIPRRVSGYNLDALLSPEPVNICRLIAGSEGTLGITTEIKLRICKKPQVLGLSILHFNEMQKAMQAINQILTYKPISLEMIDHHILKAGRSAPSMRGKLDWLTGSPNIILVVEFEAETLAAVEQKLSDFSKDMLKHGIGLTLTNLSEPKKMAHVWDLRKAGLGLLLSKRSYSRAIAFLEDISVSPDQLPSFMKKFNQYLNSIDKQAGIYGHVGSGCMHVRPYIDLSQPIELKLMEQMMFDISDLLLAHGGALSGETWRRISEIVAK